ncbi:zinc finger protein 37 homolog [Entelurus aequoreus]|uniref:zinc finger protein 37 homolog n=1 Tax=Entelurus aequoreus TaxID=161455 RepID=UPI002B1E1761|nr:zinc finger protein 37 homolog [Entelurus aequoreus]
MDDYCYAKMATSAKREHERESAPPTSSKSPTEIKTKDEEIQQLIGHPEEVSPQLGGSSTLKQETPQPPCIKKEEEELCITQEGECLLGREEADYTKLPLIILSVKTEDDEEKPQVNNILAPLSDSKVENDVEFSVKTEDDEEKPQPGNIFAQLPDRKVEEPLSSDKDCEGDMRTHTDNRHSEPSKKNRDVQQLFGDPEELTPQLGGSSTLKQETPQPPCIKKEEEELCITQEGECLLGREEADYTKFPLSILSVKTEDDEEKPQVDNLLTPPSDSEVEEPLGSETDCEGDVSKKQRDVQQLIGHPEEVSPQLGGSSTLKQETPQPPCIKKEEEELCITQEGECLLGREEADYTKFPLSILSVKTEDDEEKPQVNNILAPLSDSKVENDVEFSVKTEDYEETPQPNTLLAQLSDSKVENDVEFSVKTEDDEEKPQPGNLFAQLPDRKVEVPLSSDKDCEGDMRTHTDNRHSEPSKKNRDVQQLIGHPEEVSPQLGGSSTLKQETPQPPCIKKEEEELCITQEGECLLGREEAKDTKFPLSIPSVKTEDDEEKPQVDNLLAPLSDREAEDEVEEPLSRDKDCEGDMRTHTDNKHSECSKKKRGNKRFSCLVCAKSFTKKCHFTKHMSRHTLKCSVCDKIFVSVPGFTQHIMTHTRRKPFNCSVCGRSFGQNSYLTKHMRTHTGEKPFKCSVCGKSLSQKSSLNKHMGTHTEEKPFNCSACGKSFSLKGTLTRHMRTHTGQKPYNCSVCGKSFSRKCSLTEHMRTHAGDKTFNCSSCGKGFTIDGNLTEDMRTHSEDKTFNCSVCDKNVSIKCNFIRHTSKHTGPKPFSCSVCGKSFLKSSLTQHMRTHTGEKPFNCSVCGKKFSIKGNLTKHMRTHTGEIPFNCSVCGKGFSRRGNFTKHMRTHTVQKPYSCSACDRRFSYECSLTEHMRKHTGEKSFSCSVCGKRFHRNSFAVRHARTHKGK